MTTPPLGGLRRARKRLLKSARLTWCFLHVNMSVNSFRPGQKIPTCGIPWCAFGGTE